MMRPQRTPAEAIAGLVKGGTKRWADQRKAEERHARARANRYDRLVRVRKATIKEVAYEVMQRAYMDASSDSTLPANARQIYYAARREILQRTGKENLDSQYFCQTLLVEYVRETGVDWDIVWDDRGHFTEPHTKHMFGLGTLNVRKYLASIGEPQFSEPKLNGGGVATLGPDGRFGGVQFCEKEGFNPLFERVRLAERHDIAITSSKGMSVTALRYLVDEMCGRYGIPVFVLHDFDVSGFSIFGTLRGSTDRYTFKNAIKVIDLGLRLTDVEELDLESESVSLKDSPDKIRARLKRNGATDAEIEFLLTGRRVELNAMTSSQLVAFVERKLAEHGVRKIIPDKETLDRAYRLAVRSKRMRKVVDEALKAAADEGDIAAPEDLAKQVETLIRDTSMSWDEAVAAIANGVAGDGLDIPASLDRRQQAVPPVSEYAKALQYIGQFKGSAGELLDWWRNLAPARKKMTFEQSGRLGKAYSAKFNELNQ